VTFGVAQWLALAIGIARLAELVLARRNARLLFARGGVESGRGHYPLFVLLHAAWIASLFLQVPPETFPQPLPIVAFASAFALRLWAVASLGPYWTTRVITIPGAALVANGPYRFIRHPNYLAVAIELPSLLLAFDLWRLAIGFGLANTLLLAWRIRVEEAALAPRRASLPTA
jgi:methyltransferase